MSKSGSAGKQRAIFQRKTSHLFEENLKIIQTPRGQELNEQSSCVRGSPSWRRRDASAYRCRLRPPAALNAPSRRAPFTMASRLPTNPRSSLSRRGHAHSRALHGSFFIFIFIFNFTCMCFPKKIKHFCLMLHVPIIAVVRCVVLRFQTMLIVHQQPACWVGIPIRI